jgi:hypothetical protein
MFIRHPCAVICLFAVLLGMQPVLPARAAGAEWLYGVKAGDTLIGIADAYLINPNDWPKLQALNHVSNPKRMMPGTKLRIPVALLRREAAVAEAIHVQNQVTRTPRNGVQQVLAAGDTLRVGDTIVSHADASVSLRFVDGSRLLLTPGTQVTLAEMLRLGKTGMAQSLIELHRGSLENNVTMQRRPAARYEVKSRILNLAVRGTDFRASVDEARQASRGEVMEGAVQARGTRGKRVVVAAGFGTQAVAGQAATAPQALPAAPDLSTLPALVERVPLHFDLPAGTDIAGYRAQVFADHSFERLQLDGVFKANAAKWTDLPDGRYVLRARAFRDDGLEGFNAAHEFVLNARPEAPFVNTPLDGKNSYGSEAGLRWTASTAAQSYRVQVSTKADFSALVADVPGLTGTGHAVPLAPGQYYWRIAAVAAGNDQGPFGDAHAFTQKVVPASPALETPSSDGANTSLRWSAGEVDSQYQIQIASDIAFTQRVMDQTLNTNEIRIANPAPGTYYIRLKTIESDGFAGPWGAAQKLDVMESRWKLLWLLLPLAVVLGL